MSRLPINTSAIKTHNLFIYLNSIAIFLFFALSLLIKSGYSYGALIMLTASLLTIPLWWKYRQQDENYRLLAFSFIWIAITGIINAWLIGSTGTEYNIPVKYLVATILLLYLIAFPPKPSFIWWGIALGAIGTGLSAIYYTYIDPSLLPNNHAERASRYLNPIQYGNLSILLAILCLCALENTKNLKKKLVCTMILGAILGVTASAFSQSRGGWVAFTITIFAIYLLNFKKGRLFSKQSLFSLSLIGLILVIDISGIGKSNKNSRIMSTIQNVKYYEQGNKTSSLGLRLEMWKFAIHEGKTYPLLGANSLRMKQDKEKWVSENKGPKEILPFGHLHNEYLDIFAVRGLLGLGALLFLFGLPLYIYLKKYRKFNSKNAELTRLSTAGYAHIIAFMSFGLTEVSLTHYNVAFLLLIIPLCVFYASYKQEIRLL